MTLLELGCEGGTGRLVEAKYLSLNARRRHGLVVPRQLLVLLFGAIGAFLVGEAVFHGYHRFQRGGSSSSGSSLGLLKQYNVKNDAHPCQVEPGASSPWCDTSLSIEERVAALIKDLSNAEKSVLFVNGAGAVDRLNIKGYNWWSEGLHGLARDGVATSFPQIVGLASSFNDTLFHEVGNAVGVEARGRNNRLTGELYHGLTIWSPNLNLVHDPRWGRGQEVPGEDPLLVARFGTHFIKGLQGEEEYLKASACAKHFVAYNVEEGRLGFASVVTQQDMADSYLPAFEAAVVEGEVSCLMCSYNAETWGSGLFGPSRDPGQQGAIPSCANKGLLTDLARKKWGFEGYITGDCEATKNIMEGHHYTDSVEDTVKAALYAGMDIDCGSFMNSETMQGLMDQGGIDTHLVDRALTHLFSVQFRLGFFDPSGKVPFADWGEEVVNTREHRVLAKAAADQSLVLLKNLDGALPLTRDKRLKMAVIGRHAKATQAMLGNYFGHPPFFASPCKGLHGFSDVTCISGDDVDAATELAGSSDVVVLVVGLRSEAFEEEARDEAEGKDRTSLALPGTQAQLVRDVAFAAAAVSTPVILVVMSGGPVDLKEFRDSKEVQAILWVGYPGQAGGASLATALFGYVNPSGRLPQTWYSEDFTKAVEVTDMRMRPDASRGYPGRTYRFYTGNDTVFEFGHGLSYSDFKVSLAVSLHAVDERAVADDLKECQGFRSKSRIVAQATVTIHNKGPLDGGHVVLLYVAPPHNKAGVGGMPRKQLAGYAKVHVEVGRTRNIALLLRTMDFSVANKAGVFEAVPGEWHIWVGNGGRQHAKPLHVR